MKSRESSFLSDFAFSNKPRGLFLKFDFYMSDSKYPKNVAEIHKSCF